MGAAKPCLGYPSRTEAVLALRDQGKSNKLIAHKIGISPSTVGALISSRKHTRRAVLNQKTVKIDNDVLEKLRPVAAARGIEVNQLCCNLLALIADDGLTDAVLDDALELSQ